MTDRSDYALSEDFQSNKASYYSYLARSDPECKLVKFGTKFGISWIQASWIRSFYNQCIAPLTFKGSKEDALAALDAIESDFAHFGRPAMVMLGKRKKDSGAPDDGYDKTLRGALTEKGFLRLGEGGTNSMALDLDTVKTEELEAKIAESKARLDVEIVELIRPSSDDIIQPSPEDAASILVRGFGFGQGVAHYFAKTLMSAPSGPDLPLRNFVVVPRSDQKSSRAFVTLFFAEDSFAVYNLSSPKEFRGGLGSLLTWHCILVAKQAALCRYLTLQPSPKAVKLYEKSGYQTTSKGSEIWLHGSWKMGVFPWAIYWVARVAVTVFAVWKGLKGLFGFGVKVEKED
jgi:hypothetical protein